jgi:hypothetical protein
MVDERTRAALRELAAKQKSAIDAAEAVCQCEDCVRSRLKKEMTQCDKNELLQHLPSKIIGRKPGNCIPELSPNYEYYNH